ncbi:MAG: methionine--tRNA ligase, partial [Phycisphaeraceae bacterium]
MPDKLPDKFYITTPIYYVNDRPHIGHVYTTTVADVFARYHRLRGDETFFLTGTDEHAAKVVDAAAERDLSPQQWADRNADAFKQTFTRLGMTHDDFIRTSEPRHTERVQRYVKALMDAGEIYLGEYEGWYDPGQEEYVPESKAKETNYKSAINGRELVRRKEHNYFFRLSAYADELLRLLESGEFSVQPEARRNEVIARIREGLNDVPISRSTTADRVEWGIKVPGDETHTIYVWIDALFNYLTTVDTDDRRHYWPADIHFIAKDILWFHAVIWPAVLTALQRCEGYDWVKLPTLVYAHSFWIAEGQKMSKSLGNFIDLERIDGYVETFGLDALRYFLASNGPMGTNDSDFAEAKFIDVYNSDLANTVGNCFNRIVNMTNRYFDGEVCGEDKTLNETSAHSTLKQSCEISIPGYHDWFHTCHLDEAVASAIDLIREIDAYIERTQPFKLAKDESRLPEVGT